MRFLSLTESDVVNARDSTATAQAPRLTATTMAPDQPATHTVRLGLSVAGVYLAHLRDIWQLTIYSCTACLSKTLHAASALGSIAMVQALRPTATTTGQDPPATHTAQLVLSVEGVYLPLLRDLSQLNGTFLYSLTEQDVARRQCSGLNCNGSGSSSDGSSYGPGSASNPYGPTGSN